MTSAQLLQTGVARHKAGQLEAAAELYRQVLAQEPNQPDALYLLGTVAYQKRSLDEALVLIQRAAQLRPREARFQINLGLTLAARGQSADAIAAYRRAIELAPEYAEAHDHLGHAFFSSRRFEQAIEHFGRFVQLRPSSADAHGNLGAAYQECGRMDDAVAAYQRALKLNPNLIYALNNLGILFVARGQLDQALSVLNQAAAVAPDSVDSHFNLGNALLKSGRWKEAVERFDRVLAIDPNHIGAIVNQAAVLRRLGQHDRSIASLRRVLARNEKNFEALLNLGSILMDVGQVSDAIDTWEKARTLRPDHAACDSNRVYALRFDPRFDSQAILAEERRWNERHAQAMVARPRPHDDKRDPNRRLRVGLISPNLNLHVVGRNLVPFFREYDREQFEVYAYASILEPDELSAQLRAQSTAWRDILRMSDDAVAEQIRADKIDVLIDLALHMAHNRLPVLARRPAPVQATFAGYPGGTGMSAIDWRLTDPYLDPPGETDGDYVEKSYRLPHSFWCYDPAAMSADAPEVGPLPAERSGHVTFGCLNNFCKVNEPTLLRWSRVLSAVPDSRLLLLTPEGEARRRVTALLQSQGIAAERVSFIPLVQPHHLYMAEFNRIDIGLDTLPYNGHTTSLDSLWMGVPVVTRIGPTVGGRAGWSQLSNLNLTELAARDDDGFVRLSTELAGDLPRLAELRRTLRERMIASPLTDAKAFTRGIETAIRYFVNGN